MGWVCEHLPLAARARARFKGAYVIVATAVSAVPA